MIIKDLVILKRSQTTFINRIGRLGPPLRLGDLIMVISPAGPVDPDLVEEGIKRLNEWGYKVMLGKNSLNRSGFLAGDDASRLEDLLLALKNNEVKAIICSRGGYGSLRLLDKINWAKFKKIEPKLFIGFSDIGALQLVLWGFCNWATLSGPLVANGMGGKDISVLSLNHLKGWLNGDNRSLDWFNSKPIKLNAIGQRSAKGVLIPICLSILVSLIGTRYLPNLTDTIIVLEDIDEPPYRIDRMIWQLKQSNILKDIQGFVLGRFLMGSQDITEFALEALKHHFSEKPIWMGLPYGHFAERITVPFGVFAELKESGEISIFC